MSFCKDCFKGVRHDGTPAGKIETIDGVQCYIGTPSVDYPKDKILLFLPDAFGLQLINNQLLVDDFARNGFRTVLIDYFHGDPVPADIMTRPQPFDPTLWFAKHNPETIRLSIDKVVAALKADGITSFAATGYCFGGRYVFHLAFDNIINAASVAHPSFLELPHDLEKYVTDSKAPLLINSCTVDDQFPLEAQATADKVFAGFAPGYKREYFEGCTHGFAVRGDLSDPKVKAGKEGAFKATVEWLSEFL